MCASSFFLAGITLLGTLRQKNLIMFRSGTLIVTKNKIQILWMIQRYYSDTIFPKKKTEEILDCFVVPWWNTHNPLVSLLRSPLPAAATVNRWSRSARLPFGFVFSLPLFLLSFQFIFPQNCNSLLLSELLGFQLLSCYSVVDNLSQHC